MEIIKDLITEEHKPEETSEGYFEKFVGEDKKYKTPDDLAKAKWNADAHIERLIQEKRELEAKYRSLETNQKTITDVLDALEDEGLGKKEKSLKTPPASSEGHKVELPDIDKMIQAKLTEAEQVRLYKETKTKIESKLVEDFGNIENAAAAIKKYSNGQSDKLAALDKLLVADYDSARKLLKSVEDPANFGNPDNFKKVTMPSSPTGLTWSRCEKIRKDNPKQYNSREFQTQMHRAASLNPNFMKT